MLHLTTLSPPAALILHWLLAVLSGAFVFLRCFFIHHYFQLPFGPAEYGVALIYLLFVGVLCIATFCLFNTPGAKYGYDSLAAFLAGREEKLLVQVLKISYAMQLLYNFLLTLVKALFLYLYYRTVKSLGRAWMYIWSALTLFNTAGFLAAQALQLLWCTPISRRWTRYNYCSPFTSPPVITYTFSFSVTSTLLLVTFPLFLLLRLRLPRREQAGVFFLALLGLFTLIPSSLRYAVLISNAPITPKADGKDKNGHLLVSSLLCSVEVAVGIVAACLPAFRVLLWKPWERRREMAVNRGLEEWRRSRRSPEGGQREVGTYAGPAVRGERIEEISDVRSGERRGMDERVRGQRRSWWEMESVENTTAWARDDRGPYMYHHKYYS